MTVRAGEKPGLRLFTRYLVPHKGRLVLALVAMVFVGFFGSFNFLLIKPALEVILSSDQPRNAIALTRLGDDGTTVALTLNDEGFAPDERAGDKVYTGYGPSAGPGGDEREIVSVNLAPAAKPKRPRTGDLLQIGFLRSLKAKWSGLIAPVAERVRQWDRKLKEYARTSDEKKMAALAIIAALLIGMATLRGLFDFLAQYEMTYALLDLVRRLKDDLFRHVLSQDYLFFVRQSTGYLESRIQSDVHAIRTTANVLLTDAFQAPLRLFFLFLVLLILNFQLTLVAVVVLPLAALPLVYFARLLRRITRRLQRQVDQLASVTEESLRNFQIIKSFRSEAFEVEKFTKRNLKLFQYFLKRRIARFAASPLMEVLGAVGGSGVLLFGGYLILRGQMQFSSLMVYLLTLTQFYTPLRKISRINAVIQTGKVSAERIREIFGLTSELRDVPDAVALEHIREGITFRNVTFVYDDRPVLRDVSFHVPAGRTVAIVGQSGAGKTTLVCLLLRLFDPQSGRIEIEGRDLRHYRLSDVRRRFAIVTQETVLFNDTVARNIAYGAKEPDMERVEQASRLANAHDFVMQLDGGRSYDTVIGQAGQLLSGGQRQRIAIARAIYRDPEVLVFDEATSALDEKSQAIVQEAMNNLLRGRTAFIIAHRLSTVRSADEILVLDLGRLAERGTHDELIRRGGVYAALYRTIEAPQPSP